MSNIVALNAPQVTVSCHMLIANWKEWGLSNKNVLKAICIASGANTPVLDDLLTVDRNTVTVDEANVLFVEIYHRNNIEGMGCAHIPFWTRQAIIDDPDLCLSTLFEAMVNSRTTTKPVDLEAMATADVIDAIWTQYNTIKYGKLLTVEQTVGSMCLGRSKLSMTVDEVNDLFELHGLPRLEGDWKTTEYLFKVRNWLTVTKAWLIANNAPMPV